MMDTFRIELISETAKAPTKANSCYGMLWNLFADSFAHTGMQDATFDLNRTFYGTKLNGLATKDGYILKHRGRILVRTGLTVEPPIHYYAEITPKGITKYGTTVTALHRKGLLIERKIIMDGEIDFVVINLGYQPIEIKKGKIIAQFMMKPVCKLDMQIK